MNDKTMNMPLNQGNQDKRTGREIIAQMKSLKAEAQERINKETDRLFLDRLEQPGKSHEENMALWHELETTQAQLLEQEINNHPELAGCFYKKASQEKQTKDPRQEQTIKAIRAKYDQALSEQIGKRYDKAAMISRTCCAAGTVIGALATLIYLTH